MTERKRPRGFAGQVAKLRDRINALEVRFDALSTDVNEDVAKLEARVSVNEMAIAWLRERAERK